MIEYTGRTNDKTLSSILNEIDMLPQVYEQCLTSDDRCTIRLPEENYSRSLSVNLLKFTSEYYNAFLCYSPSIRVCNVCAGQHDLHSICLPRLFKPASLDTLVEILEWRRNFLSFDDDLIDFVRLCGFLSMRADAFFSFTYRCLARYDVEMAGYRGIAFVYELNNQGFIRAAEHYAKSFEYPHLYRLIKEGKSYRRIKRKVRGYNRSKAKFSKTHSFLPFARVRYSHSRSAYYFDY